MYDMDQTGIRRYLKKNTELTQSDIDGLMMYRESEQAQQGILDQIITIEDVGAVGKAGAMAPDMGFPVGVPSPAMPEE
jgi:hypothetical protein